jgi:hypothetical protein
MINSMHHKDTEPESLSVIYINDTKTFSPCKDCLNVKLREAIPLMFSGMFYSVMFEETPFNCTALRLSLVFSHSNNTLIRLKEYKAGNIY